MKLTTRAGYLFIPVWNCSYKYLLCWNITLLSKFCNYYNIQVIILRYLSHSLSLHTHTHVQLETVNLHSCLFYILLYIFVLYFIIALYWIVYFGSISPCMLCFIVCPTLQYVPIPYHAKEKERKLRKLIARTKSYPIYVHRIN